jgi:hypothetical protein
MNAQALSKAFMVQKLLLLLNYTAFGYRMFPFLECGIACCLLMQPWVSRQAKRGSNLFRSQALPTLFTLVVPAVAVLIISRSNGSGQLVGENLFVTLIALFCVRHAFATRGSDVYSGAALLLSTGFSLLLIQGEDTLGAPRIFATLNVLISFYSIYLANGEGHWSELEKDDAAALRRVLVRLLPIIIAIYLFVPELRDYWRKAATEAQARTGFSTTLRPGDIARLEKDETLVASIGAIGQSPDARSGAVGSAVDVLDVSYLRGATLSASLGMEWDAAAADFKVEPQSTVVKDSRVNQSPGQRPALRIELLEPEDGTILTPTGAALLRSSTSLLVASLANGTYRLQGLPGGTAFHYDLSPRRQPLSKRDLPQLVHTEARFAHESPLSKNLLQKWLQEGSVPAPLDAPSLLTRISKHFANGGFSYASDLSHLVNRYQPLTLDQFLFSNKKGFCEHYAAATASLLRLSGFASRVVVGYAFPEWNPALRRFLVRKSNAHAWIEWWDPISATWTAEDPTSWVPGGQFGGMGNAREASAPNYFRVLISTAQGVIDRILIQLRQFKMSPEGIERVTTVLGLIMSSVAFWLLTRLMRQIRSVGSGADRKLFEDAIHTAARLSGKDLQPSQTLTEYFSKIAQDKSDGPGKATNSTSLKIADSLNRLAYSNLDATARRSERQELKKLLIEFRGQVDAQKQADAQEPPTQHPA